MVVAGAIIGVGVVDVDVLEVVDEDEDEVAESTSSTLKKFLGMRNRGKVIGPTYTQHNQI